MSCVVVMVVVVHQVLNLLSRDVHARSAELEELKMTLLSLNSIVGELNEEKRKLQVRACVRACVCSAMYPTFERTRRLVWGIDSLATRASLPKQTVVSV